MNLHPVYILAALLTAVGFLSCGDPAKTGETTADTAATTYSGFEVPAAGCYLGGETSRGDSIMIRIENGFEGAAISGEMSIVIHEKDRRSGTLRGSFGADGIVRATYSFMQEGVTESIQVQFTGTAGNRNTVLLRPSAYDPGSGREYPDSNRNFSIRLDSVPCGLLAGSKFDGSPQEAPESR